MNQASEKKRTVRQFFQLPQHLLTNAIGYFSIMVLSFLKSILTVRYATPQYFGMYQYFFATFSLLLIFSSIFNVTFLRFFNTEKNKSEIFFGYLLTKFIYLFLSLVGFALIRYFHFFDKEKDVSLALLLLVIAQINSANFKALFSSIFTVREDYKRLNILEFSLLVCWLLGVFSVQHILALPPVQFLILLTSFAVLFDGAFILITLQLHAALFRSLRFPGFAASLKAGLFEYRQYYSSYMLTELSGYIKNYVPSLLFGYKGEFVSYTSFHVIRKLFFTINKTFPVIIRGMLPTVVKLRGRHDFWSKWESYSIKYQILIFGITVSFMPALPYLLKYVYKINISTVDPVASYLFATSLIIGGIGFISSLFFQTESITKPVFFAGILTNIIWIFILFLSTMVENQVRILASIHSIATLGSVIYYTFYYKRNEPRLFRLNLKLLTLGSIFLIALFTEVQLLSLFRLPGLG